MRVLILRPKAEGERVAAILAGQGHEPILAPIIQIEPTGAAVPHGPFDFVIATSANALFAIRDGLPKSLLTLPFYGVGTQAEEAARKSGFGHQFVIANTAADLAQRIVMQRRRGERALYLAGQPRKPDLEAQLRAVGVVVTAVDTYHARPVARLPEAAATALRQGVDIVLHFSRASAVAAIEAFERTRTLDAVAMARHLCLSGDIASALVARLDWRIEIARRPTLDDLLGLIDRPQQAA